MGLGAFKTAWWRQTRHFGHEHGATYSCLIFDNRGIGQSSKPTRRYTTSEMARDAVDLLTHLGWLPPAAAAAANKTGSGSGSNPGTAATTGRDLHIIGVSMGGMIAQELALLVPGAIASLVLASTAPRLVT